MLQLVEVIAHLPARLLGRDDPDDDGGFYVFGLLFRGKQRGESTLLRRECERGPDESREARPGARPSVQSNCIQLYLSENEVVA
jgi:hypothetical protein